MMAETASDGYLYLYILHHTFSGVPNKSLVILSLHQEESSYLKGFVHLCIYRERINVPELSILALFTGADCGAPSDRAFTQRASNAICPSPAGIHRGHLRVSRVWLSGRGSVHGGRVCRHSKGTHVFERLRACRLAGAGSWVRRRCTLAQLNFVISSRHSGVLFLCGRPEERVQGGPRPPLHLVCTTIM